MSQVSEILTNVLAKLESYPTLTGRTVLAGSREDAWGLGVNAASKVVVAYGGFAAFGDAEQELAQHTRTNGVHTILICVISTSFKNASEALTAADGAWTLAEAIRAIRAEDIGPAAAPRVKLKLVSETPEDHPNRTDVGGGPSMLVCRYETDIISV